MSLDSETVVQEDLEHIISNSAASFEAMSGKRVLLTGGAGFLGYYLVLSINEWNQRHPDSAIDLHVLDNFSRGTPAWIEDIASNENITLQEKDITEPYPDDTPAYDYLIHAASIASPMFYRKAPLETMHANVEGIKGLLDLCVRQEKNGHAATSLLFFSSSEVYGDPAPDKIPTSEDYYGYVSFTGPRACYDESKRYGETLCVNYHQQLGVPVQIVRPFNNYGPGLKMADRRVIPDFAKAIFAGKDLVLLSDGSPSRTFCYIADAINGYLRVLTHGHVCEPYNIGSDGPEVSILQLAEAMAKAASDALGYKGKVVSQKSDDPEYLTDNPQRRCPNITKARTELGFSPSIDLSTGLTRTLKWYQQNQS